MNFRSLLPWIPFILFQTLCVASCAILITASRARWVLGTRLYDSRNNAKFTGHSNRLDRSTWWNLVKRSDAPPFTENFTTIKEFIMTAACVAVFGTVCAAVGRAMEKTRAPSGCVLFLSALVLTSFSAFYTVHCARVIRDPTFASESAAFKSYFPDNYVFRVYFLLIFTWPISIIFSLYAAYVLWECYKNKLYFGIPSE
ncbi:hypothetical protein RF11_04623 [Thelohanellus kitauei]|uniref:Uncharacterized protein n=1 Tax=Thelohanellus kitauei TaxID=669202 RepID=A0A0C2JQD1_THEKT|nr:hypothetical protein RF11_04623 [Thelohanellus kitauei]